MDGNRRPHSRRKRNGSTATRDRSDTITLRLIVAESARRRTHGVHRRLVIRAKAQPSVFGSTGAPRGGRVARPLGEMTDGKSIRPEEPTYRCKC
jgi:hypothetical protein